MTGDPNINRVTNRVVGLALDDIQAGSLFFQNLAATSAERGFQEIIAEARRLLQNPSPEFRGHPMSLILAGYDIHDMPAAIDFVFNGTAIVNEVVLNNIMMFSTDSTLAVYIAGKVHTMNMPLEDAIHLMAYIIIQYNHVLQTGGGMTIATITRGQFNVLSEDNLRSVIARAGESDVGIRRRTSGLFVTTPSEKRNL